MFIGLLIFLASTSTTTGTVPLTIPTTSDSTSPSAPILISPPNNSQTTTATPEYTWYQSKDPNGNYVIYNLYFDNTLSYRNITNFGNSSSHNYITRLEGDIIHLIPTFGLPDGRYSWYVSASDLSGNTSRSETWSFIINTSHPPIISTISKIDTRSSLPLIATILLAVALLIVLILVCRHKFNLILMDPNFHPIHNATIYHSNPIQSSSPFMIHSSSYKTYIPHLSRYSSLTVRMDDVTYIFSLSVKRKLYTVVLG